MLSSMLVSILDLSRSRASYVQPEWETQPLRQAQCVLISSVSQPLRENNEVQTIAAVFPALNCLPILPRSPEPILTD